MTVERYQRDWPSRDELPEEALRALEDVSNRLLDRGVGLSAQMQGARLRFGFARYTDTGTRVWCVVDMHDPTTEDIEGFEDVDELLEYVFEKPIQAGLPSISELALANGAAWAPWPVDGDAGFGDDLLNGDDEEGGDDE